MAKYIDADTIVGLKLFDDTCGKEKTTIEVDTIENILDGFTKEGCPEPADVVPVEYGEWIQIRNRNDVTVALRCNKCKQSPKHAIRSRFCPNCGAYMFGIENDIHTPKDITGANVKNSGFISVQEALDAVEESRRLNHHKDAKEACAHEYEHRHFLKILMDIQPSNITEIEHGEWISVPEIWGAFDIRYYCSKCGTLYYRGVS